MFRFCWSSLSSLFLAFSSISYSVVLFLCPCRRSFRPLLHSSCLSVNSMFLKSFQHVCSCFFFFLFFFVVFFFIHRCCLVSCHKSFFSVVCRSSFFSFLRSPPSVSALTLQLFAWSDTSFLIQRIKPLFIRSFCSFQHFVRSVIVDVCSTAVK